MGQVEVTDSRLFMGIQFEQYTRCSELVGSGNSVISNIENISRPILRELVITAENERAA
jgi:hypothetical protein